MTIPVGLGAAVRLAALGVAVVALAGCDTVLPGLVGKPHDANAPAQSSGPPAPPITTAFVGESELTPNFAGQAVLPPTLAMDPLDGPDIDAPRADTGPRRPIAVVPLASDAAALAPLVAAVNRAKAPQDSRFVLLVLAPPASDAATLDRTNALSRLSAAAAVRALGDSGLGPDRIEVSLATTPAAGSGEMRLYRR